MKNEVKKWVTEYLIDGKKYSDYAYGATEEDAKKNLDRIGRTSARIVGEFVAEIDSEGVEKRLKK